MTRRRIAAPALALAGATALALALSACSPPGPPMAGGEVRGYEARLLSHGRLRTDRAPADAPFGPSQLAEHFGRIAFGRGGGLFSTDGGLHRWEQPIRWHVRAAGPEAPRAAGDVARTFARIAAATGLDIAPAPSAETANFHVLFLSPADFDQAIPWTRQVAGASAADRVRDFRDSRSTCNFKAWPRRRAQGHLPAGSYARALVLVRAGYSDAFRLGCVEEELAQAMGLPNDDRSVRPSVFNDDEEFALLTAHDEMLLRILYDPRLRPGMSRSRAMPLVARIAAGLRPGR